MSVNTAEATEAERTTTTSDDAVPVEEWTYRFKTTEENRGDTITVHVNDHIESFVKNHVIESPKWRSFSQFVNDAMLHYLNGDADSEDVGVIRRNVVRSSNHALHAAITPTLHTEIKMLVAHDHTDWQSKQEFYTCAVVGYITAGMPYIGERY